MEVYLEAGAKRTFAVAVDWPGWARGGRDEDAAIAALVDYRERYAAALGATGKGLPKRLSVGDVRVVERLKGGAGTDFGVPSGVTRHDQGTASATELERLIELHRACWQAFERAAESAAGKTLAPAGPRGGGRPPAKISAHVAESEQAYIGAIGIRFRGAATPDELRAAFVAALRERNAGHLPDVGPRGGRRWTVREAVRRSCWHLLDHAWEIEDRLAG
ncbi:MAG TPA: hypothetical protein VH741_00965 [Candidatus Limnocylindrales bacterium]